MSVQPREDAKKPGKPAHDQHKSPKSDIEISQAAHMRPILEVAKDKLGIPAKDLIPYGHYKAKVSLDYIAGLADQPDGKLILVTAITPTPAGEGKTTTTVGLGDALNVIGKKAIVCIREPSLGPCFGVKGGAAGGGYAQVVPMEDINLHFTGDFHAIGAANNLLAAMIDNHVYWGNKLDIDIAPRHLAPRRRHERPGAARHRHLARRRRQRLPARGRLRHHRGLGGDGDLLPRIRPRRSPAAARPDSDRPDARQESRSRAKDLSAAGSMAALLKDALAPNLVQTLENNPAFIHGGPFANIAHGCNSVIATKAALKLGDYVVTEAGFGADLGAEKFFDIKCRKAGLTPACVVLVATIRALKMHGGVAKDDLKKENLGALEKGFANLERHVENLQKYGVPVVVSINRFSSDTEGEIALLKKLSAKLGVECVMADHWAEGGAGAVEVAKTVVRTVESQKGQFKPLYPDDMSLWEKTRTIAREIYRADDITADKAVKDRFAELEKEGFGKFPICVAKTQYSFSTNADAKGSPTGFTIPIREVRLSAGAEFVVVVCGDIMTMPGLPKVPAANSIELGKDGRITGLF